MNGYQEFQMCEDVHVVSPIILTEKENKQERIKVLHKVCQHCGVIFRKEGRSGVKEWELRKYCSVKCSNKSRPSKSIFKRLEGFQQKTITGCWGWSGSKDGGGYGMISNRNGRAGSPEKAHRVSYEKEHGHIPYGLCVCHSCDNPECTNPDHLFMGSQQDNLVDCSNKGRLNDVSLLNLRPGYPGYSGAGPLREGGRCNA